jgi:hypothetical protein
MGRTALGAVVGMLLGVGSAALILYVARHVVAAYVTAPDVLAMDPSAIYVSATLGAGFGSVCGALAGFASALLREWRNSRAQTPSSGP